MRKILFSLIVTTIVIGSCKKNESTTDSTDTIKTVGQECLGGIVAYVDASGKHGLIAAKTDLNIMCSWGCQGTLIGTSTKYGQGQINTNKILVGCNDVNSAANRCDVLIQDGYNDWFLPTYDELLLLYNNLKRQGIGNFATSVYASSTEDSLSIPSVNIIRLDFPTGYSAGTPKQGTYYVRPCRYF
jgi:hypothetical protein